MIYYKQIVRRELKTCIFHTYIVPISLTRLKRRALKPKCTFPRTRFGGSLVLSKGKLSGIVVPRAEKMHGLDRGGSAKGKAELNGGHFVDCYFFSKAILCEIK